MKRTLLTVAATLVALGVLGAGGAVAFIHSGIYNISAVSQHWAITYWALDTALTHSVETHAAGVAVPDDFATPEHLASGAREYREHCQKCHGGPGVAPEPFAMGMNPLPPPLMQTARDRTPAEIYWAVKHGIKMSGMPAWKYRMADPELWAVTAFVESLARMTPAEYRALNAGDGHVAEGGGS
ncbi:c-type cytochrome [Azospirillum sp. ST 5-10]|uniref:c-type cytochrome n=1 Tax=unclassified Azospirillum TaxID=2630922 RepID=UPI003F4A030E